MTPEEQKRILEIGIIGENLVRDLLLKNGYKNVTLSDYRFDNKKDIKKILKLNLRLYEITKHLKLYNSHKLFRVKIIKLFCNIFIYNKPRLLFNLLLTNSIIHLKKINDIIIINIPDC